MEQPEQQQDIVTVFVIGYIIGNTLAYTHHPHLGGEALQLVACHLRDSAVQFPRPPVIQTAGSHSGHYVHGESTLVGMGTGHIVRQIRELFRGIQVNPDIGESLGIQHGGCLLLPGTGKTAQRQHQAA